VPVGIQRLALLLAISFGGQGPSGMRFVCCMLQAIEGALRAVRVRHSMEPIAVIGMQREVFASAEVSIRIIPLKHRPYLHVERLSPKEIARQPSDFPPECRPR